MDKYKFFINRARNFFRQTKAEEDEKSDEPYVTSHECIVSDDEYEIVCEYVKSQGKEKNTII